MGMNLKKFQEAARERKMVPGKRPARYTWEHQEFAVEYARRELEAGLSKYAILRTLGVSDGTLTKWLSSEKKFSGNGFRRVELKEEGRSSVGLTMVTPGGYRIEGLSLEAAVSLLTALS